MSKEDLKLNDIHFNCKDITEERIEKLSKNLAVSRDDVLEIAMYWLAYYTLDYNSKVADKKVLLDFINKYR